jgi:hypothetical protein
VFVAILLIAGCRGDGDYDDGSGGGGGGGGGGGACDDCFQDYCDCVDGETDITVLQDCGEDYADCIDGEDCSQADFSSCGGTQDDGNMNEACQDCNDDYCGCFEGDLTEAAFEECLADAADCAATECTPEETASFDSNC